MTRKFCVITVGRSGSTSLMECLEPCEDIALPSKDIACEDNELVHPARLRAQLAAYAALCGKALAGPAELIEAFYERNAGRPYAGFKTMPNRHADLAQFTARGDIQFITLRRGDVASTAASFLRASATGSWRRHGEPRPDRWEFDAARDGKALKANLAYIHRSHQQLAAIPNAIHLLYEDLCNPAHASAPLDAFFGRKIRLLDPRPPTSGAGYVSNWPAFREQVEILWRELDTQGKKAAGGKAGCVVFGAPRSGQALVASLLEAHPGIRVDTPDSAPKPAKGIPRRYVHVLRNPADSVAMLATQDRKSVDAAMETYLHVAGNTERLLKQLAPGECFAVRFEDLMAQPRRVLAELCEFLGQAAPDEFLEACEQKLAQRPPERRPDIRWTPGQEEALSKFKFLAPYAGAAAATPSAARRPARIAAGRVFYAWELGTDLGHLLRFLAPALRLRERGHEVLFAVRDLSNAESTLGHHGFALMQAPIWIANTILPNPPLSYAEIILRYGFINYPGLKALVKAWRELYRHARPGLVLADHSPTALLAARSMGVRHAPIGSGFFNPPMVKPLPSMRSWVKAPQKRLEQADAAATHIANRVIADLGGEPLGSLADLFRADENFLCTFEELDHYDHRGPAHYWGPTFEMEQGAELAWPAGEGKRVFAYLKARHSDFPVMLEALAGCGHRVLAYTPGIGKEQLEKYRSPRMLLSREPLKLKRILKDSDLVVCHAGPGTVTGALLSGVPLLLVPTQLEQYLTCRRVKQLGAGLFVEMQQKKAKAGEKTVPPDYAGLIKRLLAEPEFRARARDFAKKYASFSQSAQAVALATRIEQLLQAR